MYFNEKHLGAPINAGRGAYSSFNKFTMAATDEAKEAERSRLVKIVSEKEEATKALQVAQQKFAAANNFRIEKK